MIPIGKSLSLKKKNNLFTQAYCYGKIVQWVDECVKGTLSGDQYQVFFKVHDAVLSLTIQSPHATQASWFELKKNSIKQHLSEHITRDERFGNISSIEVLSTY